MGQAGRKQYHRLSQSQGFWRESGGYIFYNLLYLNNICNSAGGVSQQRGNFREKPGRQSANKGAARPRGGRRRARRRGRRRYRGGPAPAPNKPEKKFDAPVTSAGHDLAYPLRGRNVRRLAETKTGQGEGAPFALSAGYYLASKQYAVLSA